jgi:ATP-dependent helicase/nuclease subunit A
VGGVKELRAEASRLEELGILTLEQIAELDFDGLASFWLSSLGQEILAKASYVRRELAFTTRFSPQELAVVSRSADLAEIKGELIVAEGKADLVVVLPNEIRLVDFKTDHIRPADLPERSKSYAPQLRLYAKALSQIYHRPVTECWLYFLRARKAVRLKQET